MLNKYCAVSEQNWSCSELVLFLYFEWRRSGPQLSSGGFASLRQPLAAARMAASGSPAPSFLPPTGGGKRDLGSRIGWGARQSKAGGGPHSVGAPHPLREGAWFGGRPARKPASRSCHRLKERSGARAEPPVVRARRGRRPRPKGRTRALRRVVAADYPRGRLAAAPPGGRAAPPTCVRWGCSPGAHHELGGVSERRRSAGEVRARRGRSEAHRWRRRYGRAGAPREGAVGPSPALAAAAGEVRPLAALPQAVCSALCPRPARRTERVAAARALSWGWRQVLMVAAWLGAWLRGTARPPLRGANARTESKQKRGRALQEPRAAVLAPRNVWNCGLQRSSERICVRCGVPDPRCCSSCSERGSDRWFTEVSQPKFVCGRAGSWYLALISLRPTPRQGRGC